MKPSSESTSYFDNHWVLSNDITSIFVDHSNHFEKGNSIELRSYGYNGEPHIFKATKYLERFLSEGETKGMKYGKTIEEILQISYELLDRNKLINAKVFLTGYLKSGIPYLSISASQAKPFGIKENIEITGAFDAVLNQFLVSGEMKHSEAQPLFFTKDGVLYTPKVEKEDTPSVIRDTVIECAVLLGYPVIEKSISSEELKESESVFYFDRSNEINFVNSFENHTFTTNWRDTMAMDVLMLFRQQATNEDFGNYSII